MVADLVGNVNAYATAVRRQEILAERRSWLRVDAHGDLNISVDPLAATGEPPRPVHAVIEATDVDGERVLACSRCHTRLAPYRGNVKGGLLVDASSITEVPLISDPTFYIDDPIEFRRYCCPGCQVLVVTEVVASDEPHRADMVLYG